MNAAKRLRIARAGRCLLRDHWEEAAALTGREQLKLARGLAKIRPAKVERNGRRVPCEPDFELRSKDRRRLVEALLDERAQDGFILANVSGLSHRTFSRLKADRETAKSDPANGSSKRRISPKRDTQAGTPWSAYMDATSGGNVEAEKRFRELVGGPA